MSACSDASRHCPTQVLIHACAGYQLEQSRRRQLVLNGTRPHTRHRWCSLALRLVLYACPVLVYVYRLRRCGERQTRVEMACEGVYGDLLLDRYEAGGHGRMTLMAYLFEPGTRRDILPRIEFARVLRVRKAITIMGIEAVPRGRKNVQRYRQTWVCATEPIAAASWPERPGARAATGFDAIDDDGDAVDSL